METTIKLDTVLDLVYLAQNELALAIDQQSNGTTTYRLLWEHYKRLSELYDDIRRAAD